MARYIEENEVYRLVEPGGVARVHCSQIDELPRADVVEVRRGEWKRYMAGNGWDYWEDLICPFCEKKHEKPRFKMNFCPSCGADVRGKKDE